MITKSQAVEMGMEGHYRYLYNPWIKNKNGSFTSIRVNGRCKIWKTRPMEFRLPIKIGYRGYSYITHQNAVDFYLTQEEANA